MGGTDFDALLAGTSPEEAKRLWRVLSDWCKGDENSFPVHLALITRAQWRAAARIPSLINDSVARMELKLKESRQETSALVTDFAGVADTKAKALEKIVTAATDSMKEAATKIQARLAEAECVTGQIRDQLESGARDWQRARAAFEAEREKLDQARQKLEARLNRRDWLWTILLVIGLIGLGIGIGLWLGR